MGKTPRILLLALGALVLVACGGGSETSGGQVPPSGLTPTVEPTQAPPTPTPEPIPLPPQVRSLVAEVDWHGFLKGEIEFDFENPGDVPFSVECFSESTGGLAGQQVMNPDGSGTLQFRRDYLAGLTRSPEEVIETLNCVPDNGLALVVLPFPVQRPDGLAQQLRRQPPIGDRGLAFIVVHSEAETQDQRLILEARLSATGEPGSLDCSVTPGGAPTTYLFGDVKTFSADDAVVQFLLPDIENALHRISPGADIEFLCNLYDSDGRTLVDSRTLALTPPLE